MAFAAIRQAVITGDTMSGTIKVRRWGEFRVLGAALTVVGTAACLAACGGAPTPSAVQGKWGADCSNPFIEFDDGKIHVFPDDADYTLNSAAFDGKTLTLKYDLPSGGVTETYILANGMLTLDRGRYPGMDAVWHKQPMQKC